MKKNLGGIVTFIAITAFSASAMAHSLWINLNESFAHPPGHALTSLGWGHNVPLDDFLASKAGNVEIERYEIVAPDSTSSPIAPPVVKKGAIEETKTGMTLQSGDLGIRKIGLTKKAKPGTYQVIAESKATYFSQYVDKKGRVKMTTKPIDELKNVEKINFSCRYKATAKAYMAIEKWTDPKPAGHELELMPTCDLSDVRAGDLVTFTAALNGKKLNCGMDGMYFLNATSNTYGGPDRFFLSSHLMDGNAQVRLPTAGQWVVSVLVKKKVSPDNELKDLVGKCSDVYYGATVSLTVKP